MNLKVPGLQTCMDLFKTKCIFTRVCKYKEEPNATPGSQLRVQGMRFFPSIISTYKVDAAAGEGDEVKLEMYLLCPVQGILCINSAAAQRTRDRSVRFFCSLWSLDKDVY